jgi:hypothetical protein
VSDTLPHKHVLVRLAPSDIHGVGVFACEPIPAGTNVFWTDQREITWVDASLIDDPLLNDFQRSLYRDFAIRRDGELGCPSNFNLLTVGWYVNEPGPGDQANVTCTPEFDLIATRYIAPGEELTLDYGSFKGVDAAGSSGKST